MLRVEYWRQKHTHTHTNTQSNNYNRHSLASASVHLFMGDICWRDRVAAAESEPRRWYIKHDYHPFAENCSIIMNISQWIAFITVESGWLCGEGGGGLYARVKAQNYPWRETYNACFQSCLDVWTHAMSESHAVLSNFRCVNHSFPKFQYVEFG